MDYVNLVFDYVSGLIVQFIAWFSGWEPNKNAKDNIALLVKVATFIASTYGAYKFIQLFRHRRSVWPRVISELSLISHASDVANHFFKALLSMQGAVNCRLSLTDYGSEIAQRSDIVRMKDGRILTDAAEIVEFDAQQAAQSILHWEDHYFSEARAEIQRAVEAIEITKNGINSALEGFSRTGPVSATIETSAQDAKDALTEAQMSIATLLFRYFEITRAGVAFSDYRPVDFENLSVKLRSFFRACYIPKRLLRPLSATDTVSKSLQQRIFDEFSVWYDTKYYPREADRFAKSV